MNEASYFREGLAVFSSVVIAVQQTVTTFRGDSLETADNPSGGSGLMAYWVIFGTIILMFILYGLGERFASFHWLKHKPPQQIPQYFQTVLGNLLLILHYACAVRDLLLVIVGAILLYEYALQPRGAPTFAATMADISNELTRKRLFHGGQSSCQFPTNLSICAEFVNYPSKIPTDMERYVSNQLKLVRYNTSHEPCKQALRRYACWIAFPKCSVDYDEFSAPLCKDACENLWKDCGFSKSLCQTAIIFTDYISSDESPSPYCTG